MIQKIFSYHRVLNKQQRDLVIGFQTLASRCVHLFLSIVPSLSCCRGGLSGRLSLHIHTQSTYLQVVLDHSSGLRLSVLEVCAWLRRTGDGFLGVCLSFIDFVPYGAVCIRTRLRAPGKCMPPIRGHTRLVPFLVLWVVLWLELFPINDQLCVLHVRARNAWV